jgi:predicted metal-binding protein
LISNPIAQSEDKMYEVNMNESKSSSSADGESLLKRLSKKQKEKRKVKEIKVSEP